MRSPQTAAPRRPRRAAALVATLALAASTVAGLAGASSAQAATRPSTTSVEHSFVARVNAARHSAHRSTLRTTPQLTSVARAWARSLARGGTLAHNPRVTSQVRGWRYLGENVGVGDTTSSLHSAFMHSAPHRKNVLSTRYTTVGIGVAYGHGRMWVVEVFERPTVTVSARTASRRARSATAAAVRRSARPSSGCTCAPPATSAR